MIIIIIFLKDNRYLPKGQLENGKITLTSKLLTYKNNYAELCT